MSRRNVLALGMGLACAACSPYDFDTSTPPEALTVEKIVARINEVRRANGVGPVRYNAALAAAAQAQANLMARKDTLSHEIGGSLRARVTRVGYSGAVGEDLAAGHRTLEEAIDGWMQSYAHRATLLSDKFTEFGLATAHVPSGSNSRYGQYWALIMGGDFAAWRQG